MDAFCGVCHSVKADPKVVAKKAAIFTSMDQRARPGRPGRRARQEVAFTVVSHPRPPALAAGGLGVSQGARVLRPAAGVARPRACPSARSGTPPRSAPGGPGHALDAR